MGRDIDIRTVMARDHARMEGLLQRYEGSGAEDRRAAYDAIRDLVTTHAFAEETVLFPWARRILADGDGMTAAIEREHQRANDLMAEMEHLDPDTARFAARADELFPLLRTDARQEEDVLLPALAAAADRRHLKTIGAAWYAARHTAPNRPHPAVPRRPPGNVLAGVPLAVTDRLRNAARNERLLAGAVGKLDGMNELTATLTTGVERASGLAFGAAAAVRRGRAVHTRGAGYRARFAVEPAFRARWSVDDAPATVRLSRGAGLPDALPDILGVGVRVHLDGDAVEGSDRAVVDLLAASSSDRVGLRHMLSPARIFDRTFFSSLMAVTGDDGRQVYGFRVPGPHHLTLGDIRAHRRAPDPLTLVVAKPTGPWTPMATVTFEAWLDDDAETLALDPRHGGPFKADGPFTRAREAAYAASQAARRASAGRAATVDVRPPLIEEQV